MNEASIKKMVGKSLIETKEDFTDQLMDRIETAERNVETPTLWSFNLVCAICIIGMVITSFLVYRFAEPLLQENGSFLISKTPVLVFNLLVYLFGINYLLSVKQNFTQH